MRTGMLITLMLFSIGCSENDLGDLKDISNPSDMDIEVSPAALTSVFGLWRSCLYSNFYHHVCWFRPCHSYRY